MLRLPRRVLISPLWPSNRIAGARRPAGQVLVLKRREHRRNHGKSARLSGRCRGGSTPSAPSLCKPGVRPHERSEVKSRIPGPQFPGTSHRPAGGSETAAPPGHATAGVGTSTAMRAITGGGLAGQRAENTGNQTGTGRQTRAAQGQRALGGLFTKLAACCSALPDRPQEQHGQDPARLRHRARDSGQPLREKLQGIRSRSAGAIAESLSTGHSHACSMQLERPQGYAAAGHGAAHPTGQKTTTPQASFSRRQPPVPSCRNGQEGRRMRHGTGTTCTKQARPD